MYKKLKKLFFRKKSESKKRPNKSSNGDNSVSLNHEVNSTSFLPGELSPHSSKYNSQNENIVVRTKAEIHGVNDMPRSSYADIIRQSIENAARARAAPKVSHTVSQTENDSDTSESERDDGSPAPPTISGDVDDSSPIPEITSGGVEENSPIPEIISGGLNQNNPTATSSKAANNNGFILMEKTDETDIDTDLYQSILEEVAEFYQQFPDLQTDVRILVSKNVVVYVLGTNHANTQCKDDVVNIINRVRPKTVLVELCSLRACSCKKHKGNAFQSTPKFTFRYLRTIITQLGFLPAMIFFTDVFREHLVSESSLISYRPGNSYLHYGGEFIAAMATAQALNNCKIVLADRPIEITVKRQASAMGNWRGLRVTTQVSLALMFRKHMKSLMLNANRLVFDDPKTYEVLVFERDLFLTYSIQQAAKDYENTEDVTRIIAVIGQGHINGIQTYWGKVPSEFIPFIMSPHTVLDF